MNDENIKTMINILKNISERAIIANEMIMPDQFISVDYAGHVRWITVAHYKRADKFFSERVKMYNIRFNFDDNVQVLSDKCIRYLDEIISSHDQEVI